MTFALNLILQRTKENVKELAEDPILYIKHAFKHTEITGIAVICFCYVENLNSLQRLT